VRRRLTPEEAAEAGGKLWTDVIGIVLASGDDGLRLRTDAPRAEPREVFVAAADVVAAKPLPPRPRRPGPA
jgi:beta-phosphoglucomutase-like phosphatase (HAD superfamily)